MWLRFLFAAALALVAVCLSSPLFAQGTVTGRITDSRNAQPVAGASVQLGTVTFGQFQPTISVTTGADGRYTLNSPSSGLKVLKVLPAAPLMATYWPNIPCVLSCAFPGLGNLEVPNGGSVVADVALSTPGALGGNVVRDQLQTPVANIRVVAKWVTTQNGPEIETRTNASGAYLIGGLPPGSYRVYVEGDPDLLAELYDNIPCDANCYLGVAGETRVAVAADSIRTAVDFSLGGPAVLAGTIRENGGMALGTNVGVSLQRLVGGAWTSYDGQIVTAGTGRFAFTGLPPGTFKVFTYGCGGGCGAYVNEVYDNHACALAYCSAAEIDTGTPIALLAGDVVDEVDIDIQSAGSLSGCVRDAVTQLPLADITVIAYSGPGFFGIYDYFGFATSGSDGCYRVDYLPGSSAGGIRLRTFNDSGHIDQLYNGIPCLGTSCPLGSALQIPLAFDQDRTGFDWSLAPGASISGEVRAWPGGPLVSGAALRLYDAPTEIPIHAEGPTQHWRTAVNGSFQSFAVPNGSYYLTAIIGSAFYTYSADGPTNGPLSNGTPIVIANGVSASGLVFVLEPQTIQRNGFED